MLIIKECPYGGHLPKLFFDELEIDTDEFGEEYVLPENILDKLNTLDLPQNHKSYNDRLTYQLPPTKGIIGTKCEYNKIEILEIHNDYTIVRVLVSEPEWEGALSLPLIKPGVSKIVRKSNKYYDMRLGRTRNWL